MNGLQFEKKLQKERRSVEIHFLWVFEAEALIAHLKCPSNLKTTLKEKLFGKIGSIVLQERPPPPSGGKAIPLGGWLGHLLVTPPFHHAVQKTNKLVGILEVIEI